MAGLNWYYFKEDKEDYGEPWQLDGQLSWAWLRGPRPDLSRPYVACIGAAHTFGRYASNPYPAQLDMQAANFGLGGAIPTSYLHEQWLGLLNEAMVVVAPIMSARGSVISAWELEKNQAGFHASWVKGQESSQGIFASDLWENLLERNPKKMMDSLEEARASYVRDFTLLLSRLAPPVILLWIGPKPPEYDTQLMDGLRGVLKRFPHMVTPGMWNAIVPLAQRTLIVTTDEGKHYYPDDETHCQVAEQLNPLIKELVPPVISKESYDQTITTNVSEDQPSAGSGA